MIVRGKIASFVCAERVFVTEWSTDNPEPRANRYATDLLLPKFMFEPRAKNKDIVFDTVRKLALDFEVSLTATAICLVELGSFPSMIVCNELTRRPWFIRNSDVPEVLWPRDTPGAYTSAYDLLRGSKQLEGATEVQADGWINHPGARRYTLVEDSIRIGDQFVLSLLWWKNERQLLEISENQDDDNWE